MPGRNRKAKSSAAFRAGSEFVFAPPLASAEPGPGLQDGCRHGPKSKGPPRLRGRIS